MWFRVIVEFLQLISIVRQANVCGLQKHATHWQQEPYRFTPPESTRHRTEIKKGLLPKQKTLLFFATCRNEVLQEKTKLLVDELFAVLDNKTLSIACHFLTHEVECSTLVCCLRSIDV